MLKAHGTKDVVFSITPHDTGRQTYNISVMNMKTMTPVRSRRPLVPRDPASHQLLISYYDFLPPPANRECHLERGKVTRPAVPRPGHR